jgi:predicted DsbA family dithiol-disulfide isomerase
VEFVHFPLNIDIPPEGRALTPSTDPATKARQEASQKRHRDFATAEKLPWRTRTMSYNSRLAQEAGAWAASRGRGLEFHGALFRAYWGESKNISDVALLADIAAQVGLDREEATRVLTDRSFRTRVDADWARCFAADVEMVPSFAAGDRKLAGIQEYTDLEALVVAAGARKR